MKKPKGRRRPKPAEQSDVITGVGWYKPDDWATVRATAADAEKLENTFAEWEAMANESMANLRSRLPNAVKVFIAADEFLMWCRLRGLANNAPARAKFVAEKVRAGAKPAEPADET